MERSEVVALRESLSVARKARLRAQKTNYRLRQMGLPELRVPPLPEVDPDELEDHADVIPEAEAMARLAEVARVKRGLKKLGIKPRLTPSELERVLPE